MDADTDTEKFNNGCYRVNTVGLSDSVWSKKTDHVQVADSIKLDCDTISAVEVKVKVDGLCTFKLKLV